MDLLPAAETNFNPIWYLLRDSAQLSEFEIKRIERDIDHLAKIDASGAIELRAYVAARRGNFTEARKLIARAHIGSDGVLRLVVRFLIVLRSIRQFDLVVAVYEEYRELIRNDVSAIATVAAILLYAGHSDAAKELIQEAPRLGAVVEWATIEEMALDKNAEFFGETTANPGEWLPDMSEEMLRVTTLVEAFIAARGLEIGRAEFEAVELGDGRETTLVRYEVSGSPEDVADTEWELYGRLDPSELPAIREREIVVTLVAGR